MFREKLYYLQIHKVHSKFVEVFHFLIKSIIFHYFRFYERFVNDTTTIVSDILKNIV